MFIQTESTPNPASLKFLPGQTVLAGEGVDFRSAAKAADSPLAVRLFAIEGVSGVFLGSDFITVSKSDEVEWPHLKPQILTAVMEHFLSGAQAMNAQASEPPAGQPDAEPADEDSPLVVQIKELLETRVRPAVAQDGGDIVFQGFEKGIVYLHMRGACSGCPSSTATLRHGIQNLLQHYIPEVLEVRPV
jgi:Fe-S cluster biogenesis protein NfuA